MTMVHMIVLPLKIAGAQVSVEQCYLCRTQLEGSPSCWVVDTACATLQSLLGWAGGCQCNAANDELSLSCFAYLVTCNHPFHSTRPTYNANAMRSWPPHPGFNGRTPYL